MRPPYSSSSSRVISTALWFWKIRHPKRCVVSHQEDAAAKRYRDTPLASLPSKPASIATATITCGPAGVASDSARRAPIMPPRSSS
jgi:hypothetical protein